MSNPVKVIHVVSESELGQMLEEVDGNDVVFEKEGIHYRVSRLDTSVEGHGADLEAKQLEPERVLDIIGIGETLDGSNIARLKDQYLADAADPRGA